jgi:hypothetical protein
MIEKQNSLANRLNRLLLEANGQSISFKHIIDTLAGRGQAALLILIVLPFCQPIQIPGLSTPFGIILLFIGLRVAFGHRTWIPKILLDKKIPFETLKKIANIAIKITDKLRFFTSTRLVGLVWPSPFRIFHGIVIAILAFFLALPLPIPFTNLLTAYPILAFGLGLLDDDGVMIIVAYLLFFICIAAFASLIFFGNVLFSVAVN